MPVIAMNTKHNRILVVIHRQAYFYSNSHHAWLSADKLHFEEKNIHFRSDKVSRRHSDNASHLGKDFYDCLQKQNKLSSIDWRLFANLEQLYVSLQLNSKGWEEGERRLLKQFFKKFPPSNSDDLVAEIKEVKWNITKDPGKISVAQSNADLLEWLQENTNGDYSNLISHTKKTKASHSMATSGHRFHKAEVQHHHYHYHYHYHHWHENDDSYYSNNRLKPSCNIL